MDSNGSGNDQYRREFFPNLSGSFHSPHGPVRPYNPNYGPPGNNFIRGPSHRMRFDHPPRHNIPRRPHMPRPLMNQPIHRPSGLRGPWPLKRPYPSDSSAPRPPIPAAAATDALQAGKNVEADGLLNAEKIETSTLSQPLVTNIPQESSDAEEKVRLPKELTAKFQALKCELCSVDSTSTVQAKMHYNGKLHEKRVAQFMQTWAKNTGEPLPKRFKLGTPKKKSSGEMLHCDVCNLELTSQQHANQHYMGRNHQRALAGKTPLASGYFNKPLGKWQRSPPEPSDPTGRFNIGKEFVQPLMVDPLGLMEKPPAQTSNVNVFTCDLCHINTTSHEQLDMHYKGAKHRKALIAAGKPVPVGEDILPAKASKEDSILASLVHGDDNGHRMSAGNVKEATMLKKDYSIYRTPSGHYYCQPCNLTLNSEPQFGQHCESKRHKAQASSFKYNEVKKTQSPEKSIKRERI